MSEALTIALLQFATRFGIESAKAFMAARGAGIDDAITALDAAQRKSIEAYIAQDKAGIGLVPSAQPPVRYAANTSGRVSRPT